MCDVGSSDRAADEVDRLTPSSAMMHNRFIIAGTMIVEALSFCSKSLSGRLVPARGAETQGLFAFQIAPRASVMGLHGPLGRVHNRRVVHPARPAWPVREGPGQAGAEW